MVVMFVIRLYVFVVFSSLINYVIKLLMRKILILYICVCIYSCILCCTRKKLLLMLLFIVTICGSVVTLTT